MGTGTRKWIMGMLLVAFGNGCELSPAIDGCDEPNAGEACVRPDLEIGDLIGDESQLTGNGTQTNLSDPPGDPGGGCGPHGC